MSEVAEETAPATNTETSDLANGGIKEKKETNEGTPDRKLNTSMNNNRSSFRGGRGSFRGSRGGFRGGYRGRRGGGMSMSTKHLDEKAMYLIFEKPISKSTAKEIMAFGKDASSVGFGRGCTLHFKSPEEAKDIMEKIKDLKFAGLEPNVEYAYKKRVFDSEKRTPGGDEEEEEEEGTSPTKKQKVENDKEAEEDKGDDDNKGDGEVARGEGEEIGDEVEDEEGEGEEVEGEEAEGGDYGEEGHEENEDYEGGDQEYEEGGDHEYEEGGDQEYDEGGEQEYEEGAEHNEDNEDDVDEEEYNS